MDGTLVDTEPYWMAAEHRLVERFGGTWSHEKGLQMVGLGLEDAARLVQDEGVRMPVPEIVDTLTAGVIEQLREQGVPWRPGAKEMLASLREAGVRTALVTMSLRRMAQLVVDLIPFDAFDLIVAGDEVTRPKPFPDPYVTASDLLGVAPYECVAIEDSPNGLRSAVSAGTVALGVPHIVSLEGAGAAGLWPTLEARTAADVAEFHAAHASHVRTDR